jgi:arginyl-tRNA synthetase
VTPAALSALITGALGDLVDEGTLRLDDGVPADVRVERPRRPEHGDYATSIALRLGGRADLPPRRLAGLLASRLSESDAVASADVAGPGFLNVRLAAGAQGSVAADVVAAGPSYGSGDLLALPTPDHPGAVPPFDDLVERIGADATRYAQLRCPPGTPCRPDPDRWARQNDDNPLFHLQHAHARACSTLRHASDLGLAPARGDGFDAALLSHPEERGLLRTLAEMPRVVASAAALAEPHRVARYLEDTASTFHGFQDACRALPVGDEEPSALHAARLLLVDAARVVLANGLRLLGVPAPSRL